MGIALWVVQVLVAAAFLMSGATKLSQPKEKLLKKWAWVEDFSQGSVRIIGALRGRGSDPSNCRSRTGTGFALRGGPPVVQTPQHRQGHHTYPVLRNLRRG